MTVTIPREYEQALVFTLGRFQKVKGPGLVLLIPYIQEKVRFEIGDECNSKIVFPVPIDVVKPFLDLFEKSGRAVGASGDGRVPVTKDVPLAW
jgi:hypothetical protein